MDQEEAKRTLQMMDTDGDVMLSTLTTCTEFSKALDDLDISTEGKQELDELKQTVIQCRTAVVPFFISTYK